MPIDAVQDQQQAGLRRLLHFLYFTVMDLYNEFFKIIKEFNKKRVHYAVIGGIAMSFHKRPRFTKDIDLLTVPSQLNKIRAILTSIDYEESAPPWKFQNTNITLYRFAKIEGRLVLPIDILVGDEAIHAKILDNLIIAKSGRISVKLVSKPDLKMLKSKRNSDQDRIDIGLLDLPDHD